MDNWSAIEAAFKNGYEQGRKEAEYSLLNEYADALMETVNNLRELAQKIKES